MRKILVAEDDTFLASAYKLKLVKEGFDVLIVKDGQELLKAIPQFVPDLIILDLIMPKKDGFAILQELKNSDSYKNIPIIIASNLGQKEDIEKAQKFGVNDFIIKSDLSMEDLVNRIKKRINA